MFLGPQCESPGKTARSKRELIGGCEALGLGLIVGETQPSGSLLSSVNLTVERNHLKGQRIVTGF